MEFIVVLWLLYAVQCVSWLPARSEVFIRLLGSWVVPRGPGLCGAHPLPSGRALRANRFPLTESAGQLCAPTQTTWWSAQRAARSERGIDLADFASASARGEAVGVGAHTIEILANAEEAACCAEGLRALAAAPPNEWRAAMRRLLQPRFSLETYIARSEQVEQATRWLRPVADIYALATLCVLPAAMLYFGAEPVLFASWPLLVAMHLAAILCLGLAHRRLLPAESGKRFEMLAAAAVYPPLCWHGPQDLAARALGSFHPATVAAAALPEDERDRVLRRELFDAAAGAASQEASLFGLAELELEFLRQLAEGVGAGEEQLLVAPERVDPLALAYCPACRSEYRRASGECMGCEVRLEAFDA